MRIKFTAWFLFFLTCMSLSSPVCGKGFIYPIEKQHTANDVIALPPLVETELAETKAAELELIERAVLEQPNTSLNQETPNVGEILSFGTYEKYDGLAKTSEPIEWRVSYLSLADNEHLAFIVCNQNLSELGYNYGSLDLQDIVMWLNNEFQNQAFTDSEKSCIVKNFPEQENITVLKNDRITDYNEHINNYESGSINFGLWLDLDKWESISGKSEVIYPSFFENGNPMPTDTPTQTPETATPVPPEPTITPTGDVPHPQPHNNNLLIIIICLLAAALGIVVFLLINKKNKKQKNAYYKNMETEVMLKPVIRESSQNISYSCSGCIGQGKRDYQEDSLWYSAGFSEKAILAVIADGMGGMDNGAESSSIAISAFQSSASKFQTNQDIPSTLWKICNMANDAIFETNSHKGMDGGCTLVSVFIVENKLYWISVGDSRIYLYRDGMLASVNEEHELENFMYNGLLNEELELIDIRNTQERELRKLTSNLGRSSIPQIDQNYIAYQLKKGDKILLCSDGVSGTLSDNELIKCLNDADSSVNCDCIAEMVEMKNKRGQDNYSAIVITVSMER